MKKNLFFSIIVFIITFVVINKVSKFFLKSTHAEKNRYSHFEKIYGENFEDYIEVSIEQSSPSIYEPFVEFKEQSRLNKYTAISSLGNRCNANFILVCKDARGGEKEIWLFGGSTAFGHGLKNDETITAYIEKLAKNNFKAINFGVGGFNSTQSRILFQNLLLKYPSPYAAIFLDGNNDYLKIYDYHETKLSKHYRTTYNNTTNDNLKKYFKERIDKLNFVRLINEKFFPKKITTSKLKNEDEIRDISNILKKNQEMNFQIGKYFDIKIINILQPIPILKDSYLLSNIPDTLKLKNSSESFKNLKNGYDFFIKNNNHKYLDLSLLNIDKPMFIDTFHYSMDMNKAIAIKVIDNLNSQ